MKLLFEEARLETRNDSSHITLSFFFLARGTVEEKSTTGLYRSLLHQLFEREPELKDSLEWLTADGAKVLERNGWNEEALKRTLTNAVQILGSRSLTIFVDALDECNKDQIGDMVSYFEELCDRARGTQVHFKICFSSRHYPTVVIQKGIELILEDEFGHIEDIKQYIRSKFRLGKSKQADSLRSEILDKSSGIFLWVVLVLDILNSEYPKSSISVKKIRERLREIPPKLTDLFDMILTRDGENLEELEASLKWILFASRPLKPQELYFAIQLSLDSESSSYWDHEDMEGDQIRTYVRTSSKGLAEVTRNKASEVQFIHESVRDFLLAKYEGQWSESSGNFVGHTHEVLRDCCLAQLNASIDQHISICDPLPSASKSAQLRDDINLYFPFLEYSVHNVLYHADCAQQNNIGQDVFLADFPLQRWLLLNNSLEKYDVRRYTQSVSLVYILAENNCGGLIRMHPQRANCCDIESERYGLPILAALVSGSREAVQACLEVQAEICSQEPLLRRLYRQYPEDRIKRPTPSRNFTFSRQRSVFSYVAEHGNNVVLAFLYAINKLGLEFADYRRGASLSWAAEYGHDAVVKLLLDEGADIESYDLGETPLYLGASNGHEQVVKLLLDHHAHIQSNASIRPAILWAAAHNGHDRVVKVLLDKGADVDAKYKHETPLYAAAENGHEQVAKLLLDEGADVELGAISQSPLYIAVSKGHKEVVKVLLDNDANIEIGGNLVEGALHRAAKYGYKLVAELLLNSGAEIESRDINGLTPLYIAAEYGNGGVVELLLNRGANIKMRETEWNPLYTAAANGRLGMVKLLLNWGADTESRHNSSTALAIATENGHESVVKLLVDGGSDIEFKNNFGRTPLNIAVHKGLKSLAKLLLDNGANTESKDLHGQTALYITARNGNEEIAKLLLDKGADIESTDSTSQTPLYIAAKNGHRRVVRLLLKKGANAVVKDHISQTPLHAAVVNGHEAVVRSLLDHGADVEAQDSYDRTALKLAAEEGHEVLIEILLRRGADIESRDVFNGQTPLLLAAEKGHEAVVRLLLHMGANMTAKDYSGWTAIELALLHQREGVVRLLQDRGAIVEPRENSVGAAAPNTTGWEGVDGDTLWESVNGTID